MWYYRLWRWTFRKSLLSNLPKVVLIDWKLHYRGSLVALSRSTGLLFKIFFFQICCETRLWIFILDMGVTDHKYYDRYLRLHECSLKNRSFWKLVFLLETYMKRRGLCYIIMLYLIFLENNIVRFWNFLDIQSTIVQWNHVVYFQTRGSFCNNFLHQFLEKIA